MITRRRVIYIHGYDPQGAQGYYGLFASQLKRASLLWRFNASVGDLVTQSPEIASWTVVTSGGNWQVKTQYDFIGYDDLLDAELATSLWKQVPRALGWLLGDLVSGTLFRIIRANFRFQLHFAATQAGLLAWLAGSIGAGWLVAYLIRVGLGANIWIAAVAGVEVTTGVFLALRPLAERWFVIRVNNCWPNYRRFGRGKPTFLDRPVESGAQQLKVAVDAGDADEIVVIGHSGGGILAPCILARALELDPEIGRKRPVVLLTVGSIMPAVGLHPAAKRMREAVRRIAVEPTVRWIDAQARKDIMNFPKFDPVTDLGIDAGAERVNPTVWPIRFRDMLSADAYRKLNGKFFRMHYQFIMANSLRAPYDYFMLTCGPLPVTDWVARGTEAVAAFATDGRYLGPS